MTQGVPDMLTVLTLIGIMAVISIAYAAVDELRNWWKWRKHRRG